MAQAWNLTEAQRSDVLTRVTASISGLGLSRGQEIPEEAAYEVALVIERKAYTAAQVGLPPAATLRMPTFHLALIFSKYTSPLAKHTSLPPWPCNGLMARVYLPACV